MAKPSAKSTRKHPADMRYVTSIPKKLSKGRVLVHNHVRPAIMIGLNGFRVWTQKLDTTQLEPCDCSWSGLPHYRVIRAGRGG
jgi:hypothetical protein